MAEDNNVMKKPCLLILAFLSVSLLSACVPDPHDVHPEALKVEKAVTGRTVMELQKPREHTNEYVLYSGTPYGEGGIVYAPFHLDDIPVTPSLGNAILARKTRYSRIFDLLARGAVGEAADGHLVIRISPAELTIAERNLIDIENRDRNLIVDDFVRARNLPEFEAGPIHQVFAFSRYQILPDGLWVEKEPGVWIVKGGREYLERVMANNPVAARVETSPEAVYAQPVTVRPVEPEDEIQYVDPVLAPVAPEATEIETVEPEVRQIEQAPSTRPSGRVRAPIEEPQPDIR